MGQMLVKNHRGKAYCRVMNLVLTGLEGEEMFVYLNDIVLYTRSLHEDEVKFNKLIGRLRNLNYNLTSASF